MLYKIWYKVLLNGTSAGTLLSCISFCGMVATIAVEMGIPVDNITKSLDVSRTADRNSKIIRFPTRFAATNYWCESPLYFPPGYAPISLRK